VKIVAGLLGTYCNHCRQRIYNAHPSLCIYQL